MRDSQPGALGQGTCTPDSRPFSVCRIIHSMTVHLPSKVVFQEALARLPGPKGERYSSILSKGNFEVEIYAPRVTDPQQPHTRDEVYIVVSGRGEFILEGATHQFEAHDLFFVPAGAEHRFVNFTDDLVVWAIFYGP